MGDHSDYCKCSPVIKLPTREDLLHPQSHITHEEITKYRAMQGFIPHEANDYSELEKTKNQDFKCAEAALAYYNKTNDANYKLLEATESHGFFCGWVWYHSAFKAALEMSSTPEVFFAELHALGLNTYHVVTVAPIVANSELFECWYCQKNKIPHPVLTLSRDPQLLFSEGMINTEPPSLKMRYQEALDSVKRHCEGYYLKNVYHNSQKISLGMNVLKIADGFKKLSTGLELKGASDLKPIFRTSNNEVGLFFYKDEENQEREQVINELQSGSWEDEVLKLYNQLGRGQ